MALTASCNPITTTESRGAPSEFRSCLTPAGSFDKVPTKPNQSGPADKESRPLKFATFNAAGRPLLGIVDEARQLIHEAAPLLGLDSPALSLVDVARQWPTGPPALDDDADAPSWPLAEVSLLAPIPHPERNIFCIGTNYREHVAEFSASGFDASGERGADPPARPVVFTKATTTVIGPQDAIPAHGSLTQALDYEAELGIIIGVPGRRISRSEALDHIFGYTIINDVTARDLQRAHKQWFLGKSLDGFCPMGPIVATADELDPGKLELLCEVNGELRQQANTAEMIFDIPAIIETLSAGITLQTGDIIATGTPAGVGAGFSPPRFLRPGDLVSISITGLGKLTNAVRADYE